MSLSSTSTSCLTGRSSGVIKFMELSSPMISVSFSGLYNSCLQLWIPALETPGDVRGGGKKELRHGWHHLTYGDGIKGRVAIFRTPGFRNSFPGSVGVPGLKVSEQLSWELDGHRTPLGLSFMEKKKERCTQVEGVCWGFQMFPHSRLVPFIIWYEGQGSGGWWLQSCPWLLVLTMALNSEVLSYWTVWERGTYQDKIGAGDQTRVWN